MDVEQISRYGTYGMLYVSRSAILVITERTHLCIIKYLVSQRVKFLVLTFSGYFFFQKFDYN